MPGKTCRAAAFALAAATSVAGPSSMASAVGASPVEIDPDRPQDLPPVLDAFLEIVSGFADGVYREPAWRNPHASPRPSPDRDFVFPATDQRRGD